MRNKTLFKHLVFIGVALLPLLYLAIIWSTIPATVPTHFDGNMKPNDYSTRTGFFFIECFMSLIAIGVYFLLQYIHKIDPKRANKPQSPVFNKLAMGMVVFITALAFVTIRMSIDQTLDSAKLMLPLVGLLFAFLGNLMNNIKPNYFVGLRLPWTLSSDYNWRKTHQLAGKLWFGGGLLVVVLSFFLPMEANAMAMMIIMGTLVIIPIGYSFSLYKKEQKDPSIASGEGETNK